MQGHKSVVSTLLASNGILYSGSWDGTVRLWSLADCSLLTVLGEDSSGSLGSVLCLAANMDMLVAAHENGSIKVSVSSNNFLFYIRFTSLAELKHIKEELMHLHH